MKVVKQNLVSNITFRKKSKFRKLGQEAEKCDVVGHVHISGSTWVSGFHTIAGEDQADGDKTSDKVWLGDGESKELEVAPMKVRTRSH